MVPIPLPTPLALSTRCEHTHWQQWGQVWMTMSGNECDPLRWSRSCGWNHDLSLYVIWFYLVCNVVEYGPDCGEYGRVHVTMWGELLPVLALKSPTAFAYLTSSVLLYWSVCSDITDVVCTSCFWHEVEPEQEVTRHTAVLMHWKVTRGQAWPWSVLKYHTLNCHTQWPLIWKILGEYYKQVTMLAPSVVLVSTFLYSNSCSCQQNSFHGWFKRCHEQTNTALAEYTGTAMEAFLQGLAVWSMDGMLQELWRSVCVCVHAHVCADTAHIKHNVMTHNTQHCTSQNTQHTKHCTISQLITCCTPVMLPYK